MKFDETYCSQCGQSFGPGDHGYSHCEDHIMKFRTASLNSLQLAYDNMEPEDTSYSLDQNRWIDEKAKDIIEETEDRHLSELLTEYVESPAIVDMWEQYDLAVAAAIRGDASKLQELGEAAAEWKAEQRLLNGEYDQERESAYVEARIEGFA
jgi:uncharacterized protein